MAGATERADFAETPAPPYYAVIFTSLRRVGDDGYAELAWKIVDLARRQPGCLGAESARNADGFGLTVSYFVAESDIAAWKAQAEHLLAQEFGQTRWYEHYRVRVAKVERAYDGPEGREIIAEV